MATKTVRPTSWGKVCAIVIGAATMICLMLAAFVAPLINAGPHQLPIAVSAPAPVAQQLSAQAEKANPGAVELKNYDSPTSAQQAVKDRKAVGAIALTKQGVQITTASGGGTPYSTLMHQLGGKLAATGQKVTYTDVAPMSAKDPSGVGVAALALPITFGGMSAGALITFLIKDRPYRRLSAALGVAIVGGFAATALDQYGFSALNGNYLANAAVLSLAMASISLMVLGMERVFGTAGIGIVAVLLIFVANPLSGMSTGWYWLPKPWGFIGQLLPLGAAGTALRSTAYFDGAGMGFALSVLATWALVGLALFLLGNKRAAKQLSA